LLLYSSNLALGVFQLAGHLLYTIKFSHIIITVPSTGGRVVGPVETQCWDRCVCRRGLEARAAAPESVVLILSVVSDCLGGRVIGSSGARPWGRCVVFGALVLASVRGLGTGVNVGAVAPKLSTVSVVSSCSGGSHVGSCGARPRGRCVP
jgi:hypothetical protein